MNKKAFGVITIQEILYLFSFLVLFGARAVGLYEGKMLYNAALVLGLLTWGVKILMTEHSVAEYIMIGFLVLLALIVYKNTGEKGILLYFTMMLGMKNVSVKRVFKCGLGILSVSYVVLVLASILGLKSEIMYMQYRNGWGDVFRHALGYPHPNTLHSTYVILVVLILYLVGKQNWKKLLLISLIMFGGSYYIYLYSGSRTGLLTTGIYLFINFWFQTRKKVSFIEKTVLYLSYPICLVFSIIVPLVVKGRLYEIVNKVLNNRLMLAIYYLQNEPITLFGTRFREAPSIHYMIDSSFLYSFLQLGLVIFGILTFLFLFMIYNCIRREARGEIAVILSFLAMGITDPFLFNLSYKNITFIFLGEMIYDYFQQIEDKFPWMMRCRIQILKNGNNCINYPRILSVNKELDKTDIIRGICLFMATMVCSIVVYTSFVKIPDAMYVNKSIWEDNIRRNLSQLWIIQNEEVYFTKEEVNQLKTQGEIVIRYQNEAEPMYRIIGDAPLMEYKRNVASVAVWSGVLVVGMFLGKRYSGKKGKKDDNL